MKRTDKHYTLEVSNRQEVVSLDRLKQAYMECNHAIDVDIDAPIQATEQLTKSPVMVTRSGQQEHRPVHFS